MELSTQVVMPQAWFCAALKTICSNLLTYYTTATMKGAVCSVAPAVLPSNLNDDNHLSALARDKSSVTSPFRNTVCEDAIVSRPGPRIEESPICAM